MSKIQVLITGASGFIGKVFIKSYGEVYDIKTLNLREVPIQDALVAGTDTILHLAALVHQMNGAPETQYFQINTVLTERLAKKAKAQGVKHFVFMSSAHVYGQYGNIENPDDLLSETTPCDPLDAYGQSKLLAEKKLLFLQDDNFRVSIIRSPLVYGPGGKGNLNSLLKLIRLLPILPFKHPENKRSLIFVENLTYFIHLLIQSRTSGIFLPQDEKPLSIQEIVQQLAHSVRTKVVVFRLPKLLFYALNYFKPSITQRLFGSLALDSTDTNSVLSYKPLYSTEKAFQLSFSKQ